MATITTRSGKGAALTHQEVDANFTGLNTELGQKEVASNKGVANGYASLDAAGKVPSAQLPSYVDDVVEVANFASLPGTGETGKIYVTIDTNKTYRWSGSSYIEISASPGSTDSLAEGSTNLYFTQARARASVSASGSLSYNSTTGVFSFSDAVTSVAGRTGAVTLTSSDVGLGSVENKSSATIRGEITSSNVTTALGFTPYNATNPSGYISGNQTITVSGDATGSGATSIALTLANSGVAAGTYTKVTADAKGRITSGTTLAAADIPELTMEKLPSAAFKRSVRAATTANITLSGAQTIDGVAVVAGNRVLVKNQTTASENGIYVAAAGAWTRAADADASGEIAAGVVNVEEGTANGGEMWTTTFRATDTVGTTAMPWYEVLFNNGTWGISTTGSAATLTTGRTIAMTGDVAWTSASFNGSANVTGTATLANSGVVAGTYTKVTVDAKGRVTTGASLASGDLPTYTGTITSSQVTTALGFTPYNSTNPSGYITSSALSSYLPLSGGTLSGMLSFASGSSYQVLAPGSGTYNKHVQYISGTEYTLEAAIATDSISGTKLPITFTWRGGYAATGGLQITGSTTAALGGNAILHAANYNSYAPTLTGTGASGTWGISITGSSASTTGNAATATALQTARAINGVSFNGTADITVADSTKLPLAGGTMTGAITFAAGQTWPTFNQSTTGSAATLTTARTINGTSFNGSANITTANWGTARTLTIGSTGKSVNGSAAVSWSLTEIGAPSTTGTGASGTWGISISGSAAQLGGNSSSAYSGPASAVKQFFWENLSASATQARSFEIARLGIDFNDWNNVGPFEVELYERYYANGLKKKYVISYGYAGSTIQLVEYSGSGGNNFRVRIGSPVLVTGDQYYLPVFVDVGYYSGVEVRVTTNRIITASNPPGIGSTYINPSPSATNIADFSADSTVNFASTTAVQIDGNQLLHAGNYSSYALPLSGGTVTARANLLESVIGRTLWVRHIEGKNWDTYDTSASGLYLNYTSNQPVYIGSASNLAIHTGNYTSYAMALRGDSFVNADWNNLTGIGCYRTAPDGADVNGPPINQYGNLLVFGSDNGRTQLQAGHDGRLAWRTKWNASDWTSWNFALDSGNYSSYALPLSGGTLTGALTVSGVENGIVSQHNGNAAAWYGRILSKNSTNDRAAFLATYASGIAGVFAHNNALSAWAPLYVNTVDASSWGGAVILARLQMDADGTDTWYRAQSGNRHRFSTTGGADFIIGNGSGVATLNGSQLLHAGNYSSYALPLSGGTISGTIGFSRNDVQRLLESYNTSAGSPVQFFIEHSYGNVSIGNARGNINISSGSLLHGGNQVLHAGNYSSYALPLSGGTMTGGITGIAPGVQSAITGVNSWNAAFRTGETNVGTTAGYIPGFGQTSVYTSGYRSHMVLGSYRTASAWGGGPFLAWGGSDNNATEAWVFNTGGTITHTGGRTFLDSSNYSSYALPLSGGSVSGQVTFTRSAGSTGLDLSTNDNYASMRVIRNTNTTGATADGMYIGYANGNSGVTRIYGGGSTGANITVNGSGDLTASGNVTAYSDERVKTNWRTVDDGFVVKLANVKSGVYDRTDIEKTQAGVSAQSFAEVLPEVVELTEKGGLTLAYGNAALVSAVELAKELVALKQEVAELRARVH